MEDLFDVVVVGVEDPSGLETITEDLSTLSGVGCERVALALRHGEFVVHRAFSAADAHRAAKALQTFGVDVIVRLTEVSMEMAIEPDDEPAIWLEPVLGEAPRPSSERPPTPALAGSQVGGTRSPQHGFPQDVRLELDRSGPPATSTASSVPVPSASPVAPSPDPAALGLVTPSFEAATAPRRVLGRDPVAAVLWGLAAGVLVGIVVAQLALHLGSAHETAASLEAELAQAYASPLAVELGEHRAPEAIRGDLGRLGRRERLRFLLTMVVVGAPLGVLLGRWRRREHAEAGRPSI